jgi:subfamily B ATP-binding cassette protein MsbA
MSSYAFFVFLSVIFSAINITLLIPLLEILFLKQGTVEPAEYPGSFTPSIDYFTSLFDYHFQRIITEEGKLEGLFFVCVVVFLSVLFTNIFRYVSAMIMARIRLDILKYMRMDIYARITAMHMGYFTDQRKGDLMSRVTNDVQELEVSILNSPKTLFREPVTIIVYFIVLFYLSFNLTVFTLIILPVAGGAMAEIVRRLKKRAVQSQESLGRILNILDETLGGMRIIKAFTAEKYVQDKVDKETDYYRHVNLSYSKKKELGSPVSEFLGISIFLVILYYGGSLVLNETSDLKPEEFIAYLAVFSQIISPAKAFSQGLSGVQKGIVSASRIFSVVDSKPTIEDSPLAVALEEFKEAIVFDKVGFAYHEDKVLTGIDLTIRKGETVALVGQSGGGKSTLADLLPRFYDPTEGRILLDGKPLPDYTIYSLRKHLGIVTQESILFNDTVFNNIAFGMENVDLAQVQEAARIANAHDFIVDLPEGYDTNIGERGMKLSGGQRQRLSIARAVMKNPPILILDEATSALDSESERLVQDALSQLMKNRTSLVIAHRLSTIQHADRIVVIQDGRIIEQGTHQELLAADGTYKKLSSMQNT